MKINELMINDWVNLMDANTEYNEHDYYGQIESIDPCIDVIGYQGESYSISNSEPIPFSVDVINANNFVRYEDYDHLEYGFVNFYELDTDNGYIEIYWKDSCNAMSSAGTEYTTDEIWEIRIDSYMCSFKKTYINKTISVNEFQHILRTCGFVELADNLKIK